MKPVRFLLDENVSPAVAVVLRNGGIDAVHVRDRGMLEATDREVLDKAFEEDRVLVTVNVGDFVKLARSRELHAGIVAILDGGLLRDEQIELMQRIVALVQQTDMANCVLSVALDGEVTFEQISSGA